MAVLLVGLGGAVGALLRYQVARLLEKRQKFLDFPLSTLVINVSGSLVLGWLTRVSSSLLPQFGQAPMLLLGVGVCGAYTTFSTFSYESFQLLRAKQTALALLYALASLILCGAAAGLGLFGLGR